MMDASHAARLPQASKPSLLACCSRGTMEFTSLVRVFTDVDTCDLTHSRQLRVSAVTHGRTHRIRRCSCSRLPTPLPVVPCSSDSPRPVPCPESPVPYARSRGAIIAEGSRRSSLRRTNSRGGVLPRASTAARLARSTLLCSTSTCSPMTARLCPICSNGSGSTCRSRPTYP